MLKNRDCNPTLCVAFFSPLLFFECIKRVIRCLANQIRVCKYVEVFGKNIYISGIGLGLVLGFICMPSMRMSVLFIGSCIIAKKKSVCRVHSASQADSPYFMNIHD